MTSWRKHLPYDPIPLLLDCGSEPVAFFARRDLLGEDPVPVERLWESRDAQTIIRHQMKNGGWKYALPAKTVRTPEDYDQVETFRNLGFLVEKFGFTRKHPALQKAAEYLFSIQTPAGDFRGIYGTQYTPNYSAGIMELLTKAGYGRDPRIARGLRWLMSMRQADGGWAIPFRTAVAGKLDAAYMRVRALEPNRAKPFSHMVTGIVLRPFAVSGKYRGRGEVQAAGRLLASRFFKPDVYVDRRTVDFWVGFRFPFWYWLDLTVCRVFKRFYTA
jgi:hypothetical protein